MSRLQNLRENLCEELEKLAKKEEINKDDLEIIDKLTHSIKNLDKVMLGDEMISEYGYSFNEGYSGARSRRGGRRGRDADNDGRYSEDSYEGNSRDGRNYSQGRSYGNSMGSYDVGRSNEGSYSGHYDESIDRFKHIMQDAMHKL